MTKVSIILSSYNHGKFVATAIQSVLDQTFKDLELIVIDDASKDNTVNTLKQFKDPRIKMIYNMINLGVNVNRNKYIELSQGEYIAIMNADDVWLPSKLEKQVRFLDEHPDVGAVFTFALVIDENGKDISNKEHGYYNVFNEKNRSRHEWLNGFFYSGTLVCHPSVLMRKSCHEDIGYYDLRLGQLVDYDLWIRLCMKYEIFVIPEILLKFRVLKDESNISGNRPDANKRARWVGIKILNNFLALKSSGEFLKAFPEAKKIKGKLDDDLIPYFLAQLALKTGKERHIVFALDALFNLLRDPLTARKLEEKCGFGYKDFISLTGKYDPYNLAKVRELGEELDRIKK